METNLYCSWDKKYIKLDKIVNTIWTFASLKAFWTYQIPVRSSESLFLLWASLEAIAFFLQLHHEVKTGTTLTPIKFSHTLQTPTQSSCIFLFLYISVCVYLCVKTFAIEAHIFSPGKLLSFAYNLYHAAPENLRLHRNTKEYWIPESSIKLLYWNGCWNQLLLNTKQNTP